MGWMNRPSLLTEPYTLGVISVSMEAMRTFRYRFYPNAEQIRNLARTFGCARWVYNWGLEDRTNVYHGDGTSLNYASQCKRLTALKKQEETAWLKEVSSVVLQQSLRNLERAYTNFFEKRAGYPSFKKRSRKQSATYANSAFRFDLETCSLILAKQNARSRSSGAVSRKARSLRSRSRLTPLGATTSACIAGVMWSLCRRRTRASAWTSALRMWW